MKESRKLSRAEMTELVERIMKAEGSEKEIDEMVEVFDQNCLNPKKNELIFWPNGVPHDPRIPEPTVDEIVDHAMTPSPNDVIHL